MNEFADFALPESRSANPGVFFVNTRRPWVVAGVDLRGWLMIESKEEMPYLLLGNDGDRR